MSTARPESDSTPTTADLTRVSALVAAATREPSDPNDVATAISLRLLDPDEDFDAALDAVQRETGSSESRALAAMLRAMAFFNSAAAEISATGRKPPESIDPVLQRLSERLARTTLVCRPWGDEVVVALDDATYTSLRPLIGLTSH